MDMNETTEPQNTETQKKAYEKPTFRYEQVFVTTALSCGKIATQSNCQHAGSAS